MKAKDRSSIKSTRFKPNAIHLRAVQDFVTHHCQEFPWSKRALGALRARDYATLLRTGTEVEQSLHDLLADSCHDLNVVSGARRFLLASQFVALVNKYAYPDGVLPGVDPVRNALDDLLSTEKRNKRLNVIFREHLRRGTERHWCIPMMRAEICRVLGRTPFFERILDQCDFSGGASVLRSGEATHLGVKLLGGQLSGPDAAFDYFVHAVFRNHQYTGAFVESVTRVEWEQTYETLYDRLSQLHKVVDYNTVTVVPKKANIGRTIGKEPEILNFLQKGIDLEMRMLLKTQLGIDLTDQTRNQRLAGAGSIIEIDPYVTIDLRGASNGVITELVRSVLPPRWFKFLDSTRSHHGMIDGVKHRYELFCSMGNGFCFPLESLIFASAIKAAHRHCGAKLDYAVYGDDIIVRQSVALVVIECLRACGFRTNTSKTFLFGPFRESCGANWYGGQEITPVYYKRQITSLSELYALHNSAKRWPVIQASLRSWLSTIEHAVPDGRQYSWVTDQALRLPMDMCMTVSGTRWNRSYQSWAFPILTSVPKPDLTWAEELVEDKTYSLQDHMTFTAMLRGSASAAPFHLRFTTTRKTTRTDVIAREVVRLRLPTQSKLCDW